MELLVLLALVLVTLGVVLTHRHQQVLAWDRELDQAFGASADRELPQHRTL